MLERSGDGDGMQGMSPEAQAVFEKQRAVADELWLDVFFTPSAKSQAAGRRFLERYRARTVDRDVDINDQVAPAQSYAAKTSRTFDMNDPIEWLQRVR